MFKTPFLLSEDGSLLSEDVNLLFVYINLLSEDVDLLSVYINLLSEDVNLLSVYINLLSEDVNLLPGEDHLYTANSCCHFAAVLKCHWSYDKNDS